MSDKPDDDKPGSNQSGDPWKRAADSDAQGASGPPKSGKSDQDKSDEARVAKLAGKATGTPGAGQAAEAAVNAKNGGKASGAGSDEKSSGGKSGGKGKEPSVAGVSSEDAKALARVAVKNNPYIRAAKILAPFILFATPLLGMCGSVDNISDQGVVENPAAATLVPAEHLTAIKRAVAFTGELSDGGVPWTLVTGIALAATRSGRYSPYDTCDRNAALGENGSKPGYNTTSCTDETSTYPTVQPAIGTDADPALGPFLLRRGVIPDGVDPQSMFSTITSVDSEQSSAVDFVVVSLFKMRKQLTAEGWPFDQTDVEATALSWAEAVRRIGVVDPNKTAGCSTPLITAAPAVANAAELKKVREQNARGIDTAWRCYLSAEQLHTFGTSSISDDPTELDPQPAIETVVKEALTVAWAHSKWGTGPLPGCTLSTTGASVVQASATTPAGLFPLTEAVFKEFFPNFADSPQANRCDMAANVVAAARAFAAGETIEPGQKRDSGVIGDRTNGKGPWNKALGGWMAMPWALGTEISQLVTVGPLSVESTKFSPTKECATLVSSWVDKAASTLTTTYTPDSVELSDTDGISVAQYVAANPAPATECAVAANAMQIFNQLVAQYASSTGGSMWEAATPPTTTTPPTPTTTTPATPVVTTPAQVMLNADQQRASGYLAISSWFMNRSAAITTPEPLPPTPGTNSLIERLSLTGGALISCSDDVAYPGCLPPLPRGAADPYADQVIAVSRALGGITPLDTAYAVDLIALLSPPVFGALSNTLCMPPAVGKAIDTALAKYQSVLLAKGMTKQAKSVIPADMLLEQYATESSFGWGYVDPAGWTTVREGSGTTPAAVGPERGPYMSPSMTYGIIGPRIGQGTGYADTDAGIYDGLVNEDRALGVLQFMPATWASFENTYGLLLDANSDSLVDPHNAYDETLAAAVLFAANAQGADLASDKAARERVIAQYGGYGNSEASNFNRTAFDAYMVRRLAKVKPVIACLQAEGAISNIPNPLGGVIAIMEFDANGCPIKTPARTLRNGAENVDVQKLCNDSLAGAPNEQTKTAIKFMFANLGVPYGVDNRMAGTRDDKLFLPGSPIKPDRTKERAFDCSSYVMRAYNAAGWATFVNGWAPSSYALGPAAGWSSFGWLTDIPFAQALPGDILVINPPNGHHVMMKLAGNYIIHTGGPVGDPSHVMPINGFRAWRNPSAIMKVRRIIPASIQAS